MKKLSLTLCWGRVAVRTRIRVRIRVGVMVEIRVRFVVGVRNRELGVKARG